MDRALKIKVLFVISAASLFIPTTAVAQIAATGSGQAAGQVYPTKPVRMLTGGAGNAVDLSARYLGQQLSEKWGKSVVIENRAGLATIGAEITAKAQPDGYTLNMGEFGTHVSAPSLFKSLPYHPISDFAPVTMVIKAPLLLVTNPSLPAANLRELVELAKKRPGNYKYATQSARSAGNLTMKVFLRAADIEMLHVPYKRAAESLTAVLGGEVDVSFLATPVALPHLNTGKLKIFAISSAKRFSGAPDIPTVAESGVPGFEVAMWSGVFAPARTPPTLVDKLHRDMTEILKSPAAQAAMLAQGAETVANTPQEFAVFVKAEIDRWAQVIREAGIKPE
jgi:tripartite-type tricarboxylate transporter receptor subunit TctC